MMANKCPTCGEKFTSLARHFAWQEDHRPKLTDRQFETAMGILMGDGSINRSSKNPSLEIKMTTPNYLEYIADIFDNLGSEVKKYQTANEHAAEMRNSGFRPDADGENYKDVYRWRTICHPDFHKLAEWYESGKKIWPDNIELTPTVLTHLYCCDGHLASSDNIQISMTNERENKEKVEEMFERAGLPAPDRWGEGERVCYASWRQENSKELFEYMNGPLPDFEYKFING